MTYAEVRPIWWSMVWRGFLSGTTAGFVAGLSLDFLRDYWHTPMLPVRWKALLER